MKRSDLVNAIIKIVGRDRTVHEETELKLYSYDSSFLSSRNRFYPDVVALPRSTAEVSAIMKMACANSIPVTPRGAGSGETCGCVPVKGGIVLDLSPWNTIEEVDVPNMQVLARPGLVHSRLNDHLEQYGLFFPPDPGSTRMCTLGGMVANNSSGMRAVKYGVTEQYILGLEVVLPGGEVITTGGTNCRALKNVSGINLTKLFVGSEGTLGVITRIRLRVWPRPRARGLAVACFNDLDQAPGAVLDVYPLSILPSAVEILDHSAIRAVNLYRPGINLPPAEAILIFELDGNPASIEWEGREIASLLEKRSSGVEWSTDPERVKALWQGRSVVAAAAARLKPDGTRVFAGEDICVPLDRVAESLRRIKKLSEIHSLTAVSYGHIGDGNIHTALIINPDDPGEVNRLDQVVDGIHRLAIELGGTTTGEHGVGLVRSAYSPAEHGNAVDVMKNIKNTLDPKGIMNPGKIF
ncbi:MAG: FAD-binding oxidoreductase [Firmicutes bacterium]|nr:FAD-binding oxidoreductase [Bacillota bacterium]